MSLTKRINDLADILTRNLDLYEELAEELEKEREACKMSSLGKINESLKRKETIILKIRSIEEARQRVIDGLGAQTGLGSVLTISRLMEIVDDPAKSRLASLKSRLSTAIERVNELNHFNRGLIERLMSMNYNAASYLHNLIEPQQTYGKAGGRLSQKTSPFKTGKVVHQTL